MGALGAVAGELILARKLKIRVTRVFFAALFNGFVKRFFFPLRDPLTSPPHHPSVYLLNYQKYFEVEYGYVIFTLLIVVLDRHLTRFLSLVYVCRSNSVF